MSTSAAITGTFLSGVLVNLRPLKESDADGAYPDWFNDAEVCRGNSHHVFPYGREAALDYIRRASQARDSLVLAIVLRENGRHVGNIALQSIHPVHRSAELSIIIGEREAWGRGVGHEAARLLLSHAFDTLNLHRIGCGTFAGNSAMQKLAARLGMKEEGRRREAAFKDAAYVDVIEYGILRSEFKAAQNT